MRWKVWKKEKRLERQLSLIGLICGVMMFLQSVVNWFATEKENKKEERVI